MERTTERCRSKYSDTGVGNYEKWALQNSGLRYKFPRRPKKKIEHPESQIMLLKTIINLYNLIGAMPEQAL